MSFLPSNLFLEELRRNTRISNEFANNNIILCPSGASLPFTVYSDDDFLTHIFSPTELKDQYVNLHGDYIFIKEGEVIPIGSRNKPYHIKILDVIDSFNIHNQSLRIYIITRPLGGGLTAPDEPDDISYDVMRRYIALFRSFPDVEQEFVELDGFIELIQFLHKQMITKDGSSSSPSSNWTCDSSTLCGRVFQTSTKEIGIHKTNALLKDLAENLPKTIRSQWDIKSKNLINYHSIIESLQNISSIHSSAILTTIQQIVESYTISSSYSFLYHLTNYNYVSQDIQFIQFLMTFQFHTQSDFGIRPELQCPQFEAISILNQLSSAITPIDKMKLFHNTSKSILNNIQKHISSHFDNAEDIEVATDDIILVLLYVVSQSHIAQKDLAADLRFITKYHFVSSSTTSLGFSFCHIQIVLEWYRVRYIKCRNELRASRKDSMSVDTTDLFSSISNNIIKTTETTQQPPATTPCDFNHQNEMINSHLAVPPLQREIEEESLKYFDFDDYDDESVSFSTATVPDCYFAIAADFNRSWVNKHSSKTTSSLHETESSLVTPQDSRGSHVCVSSEVSSYVDETPTALESITTVSMTNSSNSSPEDNHEPVLPTTRDSSTMVVIAEDGREGHDGRDSGRSSDDPESVDRNPSTAVAVLDISHTCRISANAELLFTVFENGDVITSKLGEMDGIKDLYQDVIVPAESSPDFDEPSVETISRNIISPGSSGNPIAFPSRMNIREITGVTDLRIISVSCGANHVAIVTSNGRVFSWGSNEFGQLGIALKSPTASEQSSYISMRSHYKHLLENLKDFSFTKFIKRMRNRRPRRESIRKDPSFISQSSVVFDKGFVPLPTVSKGLESRHVVSVACGQYHTLALTDDGAVYSWGRGNRGQLGRPVNDLDISAGEHSLLSESDCSGIPRPVLSDWAVDPCYEMVQQVRSVRGQMVEFEEGRKGRVKLIAAADSHSLAVTTEGVLFSWGCGLFGRLGHGSHTDEYFPKQVLALSLAGIDVAEAEAGSSHTIILGENGLLFGCGDNSQGQLGSVVTCKIIDREEFELDKTSILCPSPINLLSNHSEDKSRLGHLTCFLNRSASVVDNKRLIVWGENDKRKLTTQNSNTSQYRWHDICQNESTSIVEVALGESLVLAVCQS